ncbi:hypothetical protein CGRA01v4_03263 [Colletotrichum graminicola]|nr:hypothetical protein CGRA01v4_03263 [Colletotrichum graminicola]
MDQVSVRMSKWSKTDRWSCFRGGWLESTAGRHTSKVRRVMVDVDREGLRYRELPSHFQVSAYQRAASVLGLTRKRS